MIDFQSIDINTPIQTQLNFNLPQFTVNTIVGSLNVFALTIALYPLQRIQQIKQIQSTYSSQSIKFCKNPFTRLSHYGVRSTFRGMKVTIIKNSLLYSIYQFINKFKYQQNKLAQNIVKGLIGTAGYILIYPFENIKLRMAADLQQDRFYNNIRDCIKKIKKHQGSKTFYKGFTVGSMQVMSQYFLIQTLIQQKLKYQKQLSNPLAFAGLFLTAFAAYETILYPLDTLKKNLQINGSLGHDDYNKTIRTTMKNMSFSTYFNGLPIRMANSACYVTLSFVLGRIGTDL